MSPEELDLLNFSEWLDSNGYMAAPAEDDQTTHEDIIKKYLSEKVS